jgi:prepilin-type N-terminal cleavage/methylation domain-containing protein
MNRGFTLVETISALAVGAILLGMVARPMQSLLDSTRANRAAQIVAADLDLARGTALRQQRPVRISFDSAAARYTISDRASGAVLRSRAIGPGSELGLRAAGFEPATVDLFPAGMASSPLSVTLATGRGTRRVTMSRVGRVRAQ